MAPLNQAPDPNFAHVFGFGQHLGQQPDLGGLDPNELLNGNIWDQPYQSPYAPGAGGGGMNPYQDDQSMYLGGGISEPPDMYGGAPDIGMGGPGMPPMGQDQGQPYGPMLSQMQQPQQGSFADKHPNWAALGGYLQSDRFKDALMSGIIAGQMATNPQGALQLAMQWRQHRDQRAYQAEQNELQRENQRELAKTRNEYQKQQRETTKFNSELTRLDAAIRDSGMNPDATIAEIGPPSQESGNIEEWKRRVQVHKAEKTAAEETEKKAKNTLDQQLKVGESLLKGNPVGKTPWDGTPEWDKIRAEATTLGQERSALEKSLKEQDLDIKKMTSKIKRLDAEKKTAEGAKPTLKYKQALDELNDAQTLVRDTINDIDSLTKAGKTPFGNVDYSAEIAAKRTELTSARAFLQEKLDAARDLASGKDIDITIPSARGRAIAGALKDLQGEGGTTEEAPPAANIPPEAYEEMRKVAEKYGFKLASPPQTASPAAAQTSTPTLSNSPTQESSPGSDIDLYFKFLDRYPNEKAAADAAWLKKHPGSIVPSRPPTSGQ